MPLRREDVLSGAMDALDAVGLDGLTMRRLAEALGVQPGALYWHFRNKRALLDAMAERLMEGFGDLSEGGSGLDRLAEWAGRYRRVLLSRRDGARVVSGTFVREPSTVRVGGLAMQAAVSAGVAPAEAGLVAFSLQYYVLGQVIEDQGYLEVADDRSPGALAAFPEVADAVAAWESHSADERFEFGVRLFLDGVRARTSGF